MNNKNYIGSNYFNILKKIIIYLYYFKSFKLGIEHIYKLFNNHYNIVLNKS